VAIFVFMRKKSIMLQIKRVFTNDEWNVNDIPWAKRNAKIVNGKNDIIFEMKDVEAPEFWSDNAVNIVASKYFKIINGKQETSVKELISRVTNTIWSWGLKHHYFDEAFASIFFDELFYILAYQFACFNSPVWFNIGVPTRPQQFSACFLLDVEDNMESIYEWISTEAKIFKGGSGAGINISKLRPKGASLSTGGTSSGPLSFFKASDYSAGAIKSGGGTRRAAKLVGLDIEHPDAKEFINCKLHEEKKAQALIAAGFDNTIDGDVYSTVAFQNTNISLRVSGAYMRDVEFVHSQTKTDFTVEGITDKVKQRYELFREIGNAAHQCADPGLQFQDTIDYWHTSTVKNTVSNPCAEFLGPVNNEVNTSCNLVALNAKKLGDDLNLIQHITNIMTIAMNILIEEGEFPTDKLKQGTLSYRNIGLGYSNIGSMLMSRGIPYDSDEGRHLVAKMTSWLTSYAYLTSADLADRLGPFPKWKEDRDVMTSVISKHWIASNSVFGENSLESNLWSKVFKCTSEDGFRNSSVTLYQPCGTIAFMMDNDTTGIEPAIGLVSYKKLVGGGVMKLVNHDVAEALNNEHPEIKNLVLSHIKDHDTLPESGYPLKYKKIFETALGDNCLSPDAHLKMVAAVQPFISHSISKTINLPNSATVDDIIDTYIKAWKLGIKCISVYRDGCKSSQPLNVKKAEPIPQDMQNFAKIDITSLLSQLTTTQSKRRSLPIERPSITHKIDMAGFEAYITASSFDDGSFGEVFIHASKQGSFTNGLLDSIAVLISIGLQYGVPLEVMANKLIGSKFEPAGFCKNPNIPSATSIVDYIFRWLIDKQSTVKSQELLTHSDTIALPQKPVYNESIMSGDVCTNCGSIMVITGVCKACPSCGRSGGCAG
jgi:ribonucleoside-diphosphate reductase alpha chain